MLSKADKQSLIIVPASLSNVNEIKGIIIKDVHALLVSKIYWFRS